MQSPCWALAQKFYGFLKDFALPIGGAGIALIIARRDKKRERERSDQADARATADRFASEARAAADRVASDRRSLVAHTWENRLSQSRLFAKKYYLPISSAVYTILYFDRKRAAFGESELPDAPAKIGEFIRREFYGLVLSEKRAHNAQHEIGAYFFKNRFGEWMAGSAWSSFLGLYTRDWSDEYLRLLVRLAGYIDLKESGDVFLARLDGTRLPANDAQRDEFLKGLEQFREWLGSERRIECIRRLEVFRTVLGYEINRPMELWYGELEPVEVTPELRAAFESIVEEQSAGDRQKLLRRKQELADYLAEISGQTKTTNAAPGP